MINQEQYNYIVDNLGKNGEKAWVGIHDHKHDAIHVRDKDGVCLLAHAIRMNDGGNISYLLSLGADMNSLTKSDGTKTCYEYAKEVANYLGREPYAFEAIQSFKNIQENLKVEVLPDNVFDFDDESKKTWYLNAKNKKDDELVSLYHGAKTWDVNEKVVNSFKDLLTTDNCLKEFCGPTLSVKPIGQYWTGLGFEVQIPRRDIEFFGEDKPDALIKVSQEGIAFIQNKDRSIKFDEYRSKVLLNLRAFKTGDKVDPPYLTGEVEPGDYATKIVIDDKTMKALNELQVMMESNLTKVLNKEHKQKAFSSIKEMRNACMKNHSVVNNTPKI